MICINNIRIASLNMVRVIIPVLLLALLQGCATTSAPNQIMQAIQTTQEEPSLGKSVIEGNIPEIIKFAKSGADIDGMYRANTHLINAIAYHPEVVVTLLEAGADVNKAGGDTTPLLTAIFYQSKTESLIPILISYGADVNQVGLSGRNPLGAALMLSPSETIELLLKAGADPRKLSATNRMAIPASSDRVKKLIIRNQDTKQFDMWDAASRSNTVSSYNLYLSTYPNGHYKKEAQTALAPLIQKIEDTKTKARIAKLKLEQACDLRESKWVYLSQACSGGYASGVGKAKTMGGLTFMGSFENGYRVNGEIFSNGNLMYDGSIQNGKPHGSGVCIYKGEPEACRYYKGKRIDVLFKQRIEFAEQRAILAKQQESIDARLSKTEEKIASMRSNQGSGVDHRPSAGDMVMGSIKKKVADEAADYLFDQLF